MSWESPDNIFERTVQNSLLPASAAYGVGAYVRTLGYSLKILTRSKLPAIVISVGNLTTGGTGKTPVTIDLAQRLTASGRKVAVLSRGYKRQSDTPHLVVSDGREILSSCADSGDEPYLIARAAASTAVIVGSDRVSTGMIAIEQFGCDVLLLDDGFQHIRLKRDRDIVLIDYNENLKDARLLPAGRLREPISGLGRASSIVITKIPVGCNSQRMAETTQILRKHNRHADISFCQFKPTAAKNLKSARVIAFCGIAKPERFFNSITDLGASLIKTHRFADHYWYSEKDLSRLQAEARKEKADFIVTTEKDLVRLSRDADEHVPLIAIGQETVWLGDPPAAIADLCRVAKQPSLTVR